MIIYRDTREKEDFGWEFSEAKCIDKTLETGDYTIEGMEKIICIERKRSATELANNIGKDSKRFIAELNRMKQFPFAYILCEFTLSDALKFPIGSNVPKYKLDKVQINGKFLVKTLSSYKDIYGVDVIYCEDRDGAIEKAMEIFKNVREISQ